MGSLSKVVCLNATSVPHDPTPCVSKSLINSLLRISHGPREHKPHFRAKSASRHSSEIFPNAKMCHVEEILYLGLGYGGGAPEPCYHTITLGMQRCSRARLHIPGFFGWLRLPFRHQYKYTGGRAICVDPAGIVHRVHALCPDCEAEKERRRAEDLHRVRTREPQLYNSYSGAEDRLDRARRAREEHAARSGQVAAREPTEPTIRATGQTLKEGARLERDRGSKTLRQTRSTERIRAKALAKSRDEKAGNAVPAAGRGIFVPHQPTSPSDDASPRAFDPSLVPAPLNINRHQWSN